MAEHFTLIEDQLQFRTAHFLTKVLVIEEFSHT